MAPPLKVRSPTSVRWLTLGLFLSLLLRVFPPEGASLTLLLCHAGPSADQLTLDPQPLDALLSTNISRDIFPNDNDQALVEKMCIFFFIIVIIVITV